MLVIHVSLGAAGAPASTTEDAHEALDASVQPTGHVTGWGGVGEGGTHAEAQQEQVACVTLNHPRKGQSRMRT